MRDSRRGTDSRLSSWAMSMSKSDRWSGSISQYSVDSMPRNRKYDGATGRKFGWNLIMCSGWVTARRKHATPGLRSNMSARASTNSQSRSPAHCNSSSTITTGTWRACSRTSCSRTRFSSAAFVTGASCSNSPPSRMACASCTTSARSSTAKQFAKSTVSWCTTWRHRKHRTVSLNVCATAYTMRLLYMGPVPRVPSPDGCVSPEWFDSVLFTDRCEPWRRHSSPPNMASTGTRGAAASEMDASVTSLPPRWNRRRTKLRRLRGRALIMV